MPQELRYIVRNESILAKNVTKLEIISNEMIFLLQNAGELHIIAPLRENKESCKQKSIAEMKKVPQNLHS